jgi:hypothetical protein
MNAAFHARPARRIAFALFVLAAAFANAAQALDLTSLLMNQTGVTKPQAVGGAGSIFKYAKSQMTAENFGLVKQAVPGMSKYLAAAPAVNPKPAVPNALSSGAAAAGFDSGSLMNGASQALQANGLGGIADKLGAAQALAPAFQKLGLKPEMVGRFVPIVVDYVKSSGGSPVANLLTGALGM